ncbi:helicase RepA family protein [Massilia norwichensis]|uniref:Helicase RepA family protein n=1 Tax=Massilia norwichensis TaxID=1442366 RepID=A0ABT2A8K1_9BURK|nr:helicase RepA family protein [Massilia norwichensis]MCS0590425.1 helicase RepA family protein [Massilia norwichensis]
MSIREKRRGSVALGAFLELKFPPDNELLGKMILEKSIGMIAGPRGGGKSWNAMIFAYAVAAGKTLLPWGVGRSTAVTYLDGEMRATGVQERFRLLHTKDPFPSSRARAETNFHIVSRDYIGDPIGSLDTEEGQAKIDSLIRPATKLLIVDNLSAWTSGGREDSNAWAVIKNWLIKKRLLGIAVLLIHHAGKNGQQRGSSVHEDLLDYSILLSSLPSRSGRDETRFSVYHSKLRDYIPELRPMYECSISSDGEGFDFEFYLAGSNQSPQEIQMIELAEANMSMTAIAKQLGFSTAKVSRFFKKYRELQKLAPEASNTSSEADDE